MPTKSANNALELGFVNYIPANNTLRLFEYTTNALILWTGATPIITSANNTVVLNAWSHLAIVRSGTTLTIYINGVAVGSATNSTSFTAASTAGVGSNISGGQTFNGVLT